MASSRFILYNTAGPFPKTCYKVRTIIAGNAFHGEDLICLLLKNLSKPDPPQIIMNTKRMIEQMTQFIQYLTFFSIASLQKWI